MDGEDEKQSAEETERADPAASGSTFHIGEIDSQIVNAGGQMNLSGGVTINVASDNATQNIHSRLEHAQEAAEKVPHGDEAQREKLVQLVESLRAELQEISTQHEEEVLKLAKRLDALIAEVQEEDPDPEMVDMTGQGLKKAAENLAAVLPTVARIAVEVVSQAGLLVR